MSTINTNNPIQNLRNWSAAAKAPAGPNYDEALQSFQHDSAVLQTQDRTDVSPKNLSAWSGPTDTDARPGEVEILGTGSLHTTPEGFAVHLQIQPTNFELSSAGSMTSGESHNYEVNSKNGTINVSNQVGPTFSCSAFGESSTPAYQERYTLDTVHGNIVDYAKNPVSQTPTGFGAGIGSIAGFDQQMPGSNWSVSGTDLFNGPGRTPFQ